jgi:hydroxypyruvate reductase
MNLPSLHQAAREIFDEALKSVDAGLAVRRAVHLNNSQLQIVHTAFNLEDRASGIYAIAIGKAAHPMAEALSEILGERLKALVESGVWSLESGVNSSTTAFDSRRAFDVTDSRLIFAGGHPLPDSESLRAAQAAFELLRRAEDEHALVIFLISGGGSAMMEWPRDSQTTLEELQETNRLLISCGAQIAEINAVRRAISSVKGGGLAALAPSCDQVSLIISDTNPGEETTVASGPTFDPPLNAPDPLTVIARYNLEARLPQSILRAIGQSARGKAPSVSLAMREHHVLLDNVSAIEAAAEAARSRGIEVEVARDIIEQPIAEGCSALLSRLLDLRSRTIEGRPVCLISGGEFACPVRGPGLGGRNTESALRWAIELEALAKEESITHHIVALSAGTDGIDGNSSAAGAAADETSVERARLRNLDAHRFLDESDAYTFFHALGDAIVTGPTGTNVRDLRVLLAS